MGRISIIDLLVLTSLDQLPLILNLYIFIFYKTTYLNAEVKRTEPSPSASAPWFSNIGSNVIKLFLPLFINVPYKLQCLSLQAF
jgi:ABC-type transport system involved in multi-copper enzyme maturation permease subunit